MNLKILYVLHSAALNGSERSFLDLVQALRDEIVPYVILPSDGVVRPKLEKLRINYYIISNINDMLNDMDERNFFYRKLMKDNMRAAQKISDIILSEGIHLVHVNSSVNNTGAIAAILSNIPYVWHFREFGETDFRYSITDLFFKEMLVRNAGKIITISKSVQSHYLKKYGWRSLQLYNGVNADNYVDNIKAHNYSNNVFLLAGTICDGKGQLAVVRAAKKLVSRGIRDFKILIVGNGSFKDIWTINHFIKTHSLSTNIEVHSFVDNLKDLRKNCSFAIVPSKMEGLGRVTIEAMLAGNVVVGADSGGTGELIKEDGRYGLLFDVNNIEEIGEKMKEAIEMSENNRKRIAENAFNYMIDLISLERYSDRVKDLYIEMCKERKNSYELVRSMLFQYKTYMEEYNADDTTAEITGRCYDKKETDIISLMRGKDEDWKKAFSDYFAAKEFFHVAIYGMGEVGTAVYDLLSEIGIVVDYVVDRNPGMLADILAVYKPGSAIPATQLLVVALNKGERYIVEEYRKKVSFDVMSVYEICGIV